MIWVCSSRNRILIFYPSRTPDPGVKMAPDPDPGSGSATLLSTTVPWYNMIYVTTVPVPILSHRYMRAAAVPWHKLHYSPCPTETWGPRRYHDIRYGTHLVQQTHEGRGGTMTYVTLLTLSDRHMRAAVVPWHTGTRHCHEPVINLWYTNCWVWSIFISYLI